MTPPPVDCDPTWPDTFNPFLTPDLLGQQLPAGARIETVEPLEEYL